MLKSFLRCDALLGVVDEDASKEVKELSVEVGVVGYRFLDYISLFQSAQSCNLQEVSS